MKLESGEAGTLDILINQLGDYGRFSLSFFRQEQDGQEQPLDLSQYDNIRMDIKVTEDTSKNPVIRKETGNGLGIHGDNNNIISFDFSEEMYGKKHFNYFYSIAFVKGEGVKTYLKGRVIFGKTTTKGT